MRRCNCRCNSRNMNYNSNNNSNNNCGCRNSNTNNSNSCGCNMYTSQNNNNAFPENYLYGHAYTPNQCMGTTFTPEIGLQNGTIFPELVSPYSPGQSIDFIEFLRNGGM
ncbi:MAG: spore coat associated protein CotJA [Clostridia bacterium]|nr:spore coat associated protein CotJA [Clostridia bacterium]